MTYTPEQMISMRKALGLSRDQAAQLLETDVTMIQKLERNRRLPSSRRPPARYGRLLEAMVQGYRPADWPQGV